MLRYQFNALVAWSSANGGERMHGSKDLNALAAGFHKPPQNDFDTQWRRKVDAVSPPLPEAEGECL
jgi:hypothetical protein